MSCTEDDIDFLVNFWGEVSRNITEWNELLTKEITKKELKENYIVTLAITIQAFGKLGRVFYENRDLDYKNILHGLTLINWSRDNDEWIGVTVRENGKVLNSEESISLTCKKIEELLGLVISEY